VNKFAARSVQTVAAVATWGTGLDPGNAGRIFDGFFTTRREAIGMGAAVSRWIIEARGGALSAAPDRPYGSIFQFAMPGAAERNGGDDGS
jgi:K+-sensing histidine kinase KdpD